MTGPTGTAGTNGTNGTNGVTGPTGPGTICGTATTNYVVKFTAPTTMCNSIIFDNGTQVGIGTTTPATGTIAPTIKLFKVQETGVAANSSGMEVVNTSANGVALTSGNSNAADAYNAFEGVTYGTYSGVFGLHIPTTGTGYGGYFVTNSTDANAYGLYSQMPTGSAGWAAYFNGDINVTGATYNISDRNLKSDITPLANAIEKLKQLNGVSYYYKKDVAAKFGLTDKHVIGVLAQDVEAVFPELIKESNIITKSNGKATQANTSETMKVKTVNYQGLIPVLIEAIKEQQKQIEDLQKQVELLKK